MIIINIIIYKKINMESVVLFCFVFINVIVDFNIMIGGE